jgi:uncharacterized protein (TIGR02246 family)
MKNRKWLALAMGLAALVAVGGFIATGMMPAVAEEQSAKDKEQSAKDKEQSAKDSAQSARDKKQPATKRRAEFIAAFNKGDAKAVAAFWTEDATYVDQVGHEYKGRSAIEKLYEKVFAARKGAKLAIYVTETKKVAPEVVLNDGFTEVTPADGGPATTARFSAVLVKKDGEWYLQSVRDSLAPPPSNGDHLEDLGWLIGEWTGESEKGQSGSATFEWAENENFIVSSFNTTLNGIPVYGGTQWIGWDAIDKRIRSWSFYSGGGFGEAFWTKDGKKWLIKTTARTASGKKVSATNVVTKTDDDHMTWQMTKLTVDGKLLPDNKPVKMKRVKEPE